MKAKRLQALTLPERYFQQFHDIIHMALGVDLPGNRQMNELAWAELFFTEFQVTFAKLGGADFHCPNAYKKK